jgi:predicted phosphodiesterase
VPVALVSDIHGNDAGLAAVVSDLGQVEKPLGGSGVDLLAGGHTHLQWTRYVDGALFVNPGSVGLAYDRFDAERVEFRRIPWASAS